MEQKKTYKKVEVVAKNDPRGTYAAGCPAQIPHAKCWYSCAFVQ